MGDRANIYVKEDAERGVYLYTHWAGTDLPRTLQTALDRGRERWGDTPYLARIVFCEMVDRVEKDLTGYGISTVLCDNEYPIIVLDDTNRRLGLAPEPPTDHSRLHPIADHWVTYEEYISSRPMDWGLLRSLCNYQLE